MIDDASPADSHRAQAAVQGRPVPLPEYAPDARRHLLLVDLLTMTAGVLIATALHRPLEIAPVVSSTEHAAAMLLFATFTLITLLRLGLGGQYDSGQRFSRIDDAFAVIRATFIAAAIAVFLRVLTEGFFLGTGQPPRDYIAVGFVLPVTLLLIVRLLGHRMQIAAFHSGRYLARTLVVGSGPRADRFMERLVARPHLGMIGKRSEADVSAGLSRYMAEFTRELEEFEPDEVILALEDDQGAVREAIVRDASFKGIDVKVLPEVFENYVDMPFPRYEGIPVTTIFETPGRRFSRSLKHGLDRVFALLLLIVLTPLLLAITCAIWLEDRTPIIFAQERVGERGKRFLLRKFRTMGVDAEARRKELESSNEADGPIFKMRADPRVTRVGRVLRRTSLDELPQLWNVAFGEMSLVGPRPPLASEVDEYRTEHRRRLLARPGMTGLWQVSGRSETTFDEMVRLDLVYIENMSFWFDLKILVRTVVVLLRRRGAY
ncbi:MAG: undecaprenyl-phosphate glucose phosphotransferase [Thermoleophilia bacterium]|nr:undecaprenyl-phosphate glucose phosphotransferase [Thermoleophilia bacterium]